MTKEEILSKSREENRERDLYQLETDRKATNLALGIIILFSAIIYALNIFAGKGFLPEAFAPVAIFNAAFYTSRYRNDEEKKKSGLLCMVCWIFTAVLLAVAAFAKALS